MPRAHMMKDTLGGGHEDQSATIKKLLKPIHHHSRAELEKAGYVEDDKGDWHKKGEEPEHEERKPGDPEQNERDLIEHHAHDHETQQERFRREDGLSGRDETEDARIARERHAVPEGDDDFAVGRHVAFDAEKTDGEHERLTGKVMEHLDDDHVLVEAGPGQFRLHRDELETAPTPIEPHPSEQGLVHSPQPSSEDALKAEAERAAHFGGKPFQGQDQLGVSGQKSLLQEEAERLNTAHESEAGAASAKDQHEAEGIGHEHHEQGEDLPRDPPAPTPEPGRATGGRK